MTNIYNVAAGGDSSAQLDSAASLRYGIQLNGASGLVGKKIKTFTPYLRKVTTPAGNITATVRDSVDNIRTTSNESIDATTLSTTSSPVIFTFPDPPITLASGDRIIVEYGGNAGIRIEIYTTDKYDGALTRRTRFQSSVYSESSTTDIVASIDDGITPSATSFTPRSFTEASFTGGGKTVVIYPSTQGKRNRYRQWIKSWARDLREFFKIKPFPPPPPLVEIPEPQSPAGQKITILSSPPTKENPISVSASIQSSISRDGMDRQEGRVLALPLPVPPVYPLILNPLTSPLIQTKVTLPKAIKQPAIPIPIRSDGAHIESTIVDLKKPKNKSKAAATINTLMILLEIERQV